MRLTMSSLAFLNMVCAAILLLPTAAGDNFTVVYLTHDPTGEIGYWDYAPVINLAIADFQSDGGLAGHNIQLHYVNTNCVEKKGVAEVLNTYSKYRPHAYLGLSCDRGTLVTMTVAYYLSYFNVPIFPESSIGAGLANKETYNTVVRIKPSYSKMASAIVEIFHHYAWTTTAMLTTSQWYCAYAVDAIRDRLAEDNIQLNEWIKGTDGMSDALVDSYLNRLRLQARIIIICSTIEDRLKIMYRAQEKGMTTNEYVYVFYDMLPNDHGRTDIPWAGFEGTQLGATTQQKQAFFSFKQLTMAGLDGAHIEGFFDKVPSRGLEPPWNTDRFIVNGYSRHLNTLFLHDATLLWLIVLEEILKEGLDPRDGSVVFNKTRHRVFQGISGSVLMDDVAEREPSYWLWSYGPGDDAFKAAVTIDMTKPTDQRISPMSTIYWGTEGNTPPKDIPECGYDGSLCPADASARNAAILAGVVGILIVSLAIGFWFCLYRRRRKEQELHRMHWKIRYGDIETRKMTESGITSSIRSLRSGKTKATNSMADSAVEDAQVFCDVGIYKGLQVALIRVNKSGIFLNRQDLLELKEMREMTHENVAQFVGACVDPPNICYVVAYCSKGSLEDIIENDEIKLDWTFKTSLISDLVQGMAYLHTTVIHSHGCLKSGNCLVDGRWVLKVTSYGLNAFKSGQVVDYGEYEKYKRLLCTAPELLRMNETPRYGTQKGDVYSFAFVLQELIFRAQPFFLGSGDSKVHHPIEVVERVKKHLEPPYRPELPGLDDDSNPAIIDLILESWNENPDKRPDFETIKKRLRLINKGKKTNILDTMLDKLEKYATNLEDIVTQRTGELIEEKKKTESLLNRMLPLSVVEQLKLGKTIEAELYDDVTVYFSDIVGFTDLSSESSPMQVVDLLNDLYTQFDEIIDKHDVYKVETIGDAYMVVSGLPEINGDRHAGEIANMALDLLSIVHTSFRVRHRPEHRVKLRIGMHTGPCAAGVVGQTMPRYCLFGDTVNMASRMESNGAPLKIHLSSAAYHALRKLVIYHTKPRGQIEIKGKGLQSTYWLLGRDNFLKKLPPFEES